MHIPSLVEMLKAGVHFGHKKSKRHPNMEPYIFATRNDIHIIDVEQTQQKLEEALKAIKDLASQGRVILFVGTKKHAAPLVRSYAEKCNMPYVSNRWLGGTITNFKTISSVAQKLTKLKDQRESGELEKYTKKEQLDIDREIERLETIVGGIEHLQQLPDAVFVVDMREDKTAVREAQQMHIPLFAITDTNTDPNAVDYPIPGNDDAIRSVELVVKVLAEAILEGRAEMEKERQETQASS